MSTKPVGASLRTYQVGFGDCLLLRVDYPEFSRHVLFDFGTTKRPEGASKDRMLEIAEDIAEATNGALDAIVITHRHADHNSGFAGASGDVIARLGPKIVVQPWTEDPRLDSDATAPRGHRAYRHVLHGMNAFSDRTLAMAESAPRLALGSKGNELRELARNNGVSPAAARIQALPGKHVYVHHGSETGLESVLPGVDVRVLGPPTLEQSNGIRKQRATDPEEFWSLRATRWQALAADAVPGAEWDPFGADVKVIPRAAAPAHTRWFCDRVTDATDDLALELVRTLDRVLNNTSVILLMTIGKAGLLFPGDAQIENWEYALGQEEVCEALAKVTVYKVGHHGSLNATPRSVWKMLCERKDGPGRLQTFLSTLSGKHGHVERNTEVPRTKLVDALREHSELVSTEDFAAEQLYRVTEIPIG
ncbi:MAG TPA: hypothetical protein VM925_17860 [Labilithrix sp.]|nr:hypothetical protein [Labilithrix sp.]